MIDLSELSIVIPFRYDTEHRTRNLDFVIRYFQKYFINYELIVLESAPEKKIGDMEQYIQKYVYEKNTDLLHRTRMLNDGVKMSNRKFVTCYDTDVVFRPEAIAGTMELLRKGHPFIFPYNGIFLEIEHILQGQFLKTIDFNTVPMLSSAVLYQYYGSVPSARCIHPSSVGGATFFNKNIFLSVGGYNKKFVAWGFEDNEIVVRFSMMGYIPIRVTNSNLYHITHTRLVDSSPNHAKATNNEQELEKVKRMNKQQMVEYIKELI
jgi:hypothetical protein